MENPTYKRTPLYTETSPIRSPLYGQDPSIDRTGTYRVPIYTIYMPYIRSICAWQVKKNKIKVAINKINCYI
jgi:hypothetical protein